MSRPQVVSMRDAPGGGVWLRCPTCHKIRLASEEQYRGRAPIECECGYEETHDLSREPA